MSLSPSRFAALLSAVFLLVTSVAQAADPVISEFMADNKSTLVDQDGEYSDWIEIRNPGPDSVNLEGWFLTDAKTNKSKWRFPRVTVPVNGHLIVFASGKNRAVSGQQLHTNFQLSAGGEFLALVKPDGTTATTVFDPFPAQVKDVSYGAARLVQQVMWMDKGAPARGFVPTDNTLGHTWRERSFDDNGWLSGTLGAGYFSNASPDLSGDTGLPLPMQNVSSSAYVRVPFTVPDVSKVSGLILRIKYDDGFAAFVNGQFAGSKLSPAPGALTNASAATQSHAPTSFEDVDIGAMIPSLTSGENNVLAIHLLNASAASNDAFVLPQIVAEVAAEGQPQIGFFSPATPGAANGGPGSLRIPQTVVFSRPAGNFTASFQLSLSGASPGYEIRYVTAAPGTTAAQLPEPTATSTLYNPESPISVSASTLIRAAIFDPATGQRSATTTAQYLLLETAAGPNNTSNFTSNLPIFVADVHGANTVVDSGTNAYSSSLLYVYEPVNGIARLNTTPNRFTRSGFRIRGSSSQGFAKKSYGMELWDEKNLDLDQPLLGMASDSDWILNGPWLYDDTYIHNAYIYEISRRAGRWAPRTHPVELFFNQNGGKLDYNDYAGVYMLTEKIKSMKERLDIVPLQVTDNTGDAVTGGYIFKNDRQDPNEVGWQTTTGTPSSDRFVLVEPDPDFDTPQQISYIQGAVQAADTALLNDRNSNFATRNYRTHFDVPSFVDHHILNSISYNVDALRLSAFYFKDRLDKINAGPIWDFDRALGSDDGRDSNPASWANIEYFFSRDWWGRMFQDPDFVQAWIDRWWELRQPGKPFDLANLNALADQMGAQIGNAAGARDAAKWPDNAAAGGVYLNEITAMKNWLTTRVNWIDAQVHPPATVSLASGVVNAGQTVTISGTGTIRYTTNGTDPRPPGGAVPGTGTTYTGQIALNETTVLTVRRQLPAPTRAFTNQAAVAVSWSAPVTRVYLVNEVFAAPGDIAISEINYNPLEPTPAERAAIANVTADDFEWIELRNVGSRKVNLFEAKFAGGQPFNELTLAPLSLNPGDFALVVKNRAAFLLRYGTAFSSRIVGEWGEGSLDNDGETVRIVARDGAELQNFAYSDSGKWPGRADGKGSTLEYVGMAFSNADYLNPLNWRSSSEIQGSPGAAGLGPDRRVVINEVLSHSDAPFVDAIELFNTTNAPIDISGWYLSDRGNPEIATDFAQYRIPANTVIPANGYVVFTEAQFNPNGPWNPNAAGQATSEFAFDANGGEDAWLIEADAAGKLLRVVDHVDFGAARANEAWGRWLDATGKLYPMLARTLLDENSATVPRPGLGAPNSTPRVGPVIINEVQHSPPGNTPDSDNPDLEFVELRNPGTTTESLNRWVLRGAVDFDFTESHSIAPGGVLLVVPFPPSDSAKANAFRNAYGLTANVPLAGPWSPGDRLGATGRVTLYRAGIPPQFEPDFYPRLLEDEVNYASNDPWPVANSGASLNRIGSSSVGDLAASWTSDTASPGRLSTIPPDTQITSGPMAGSTVTSAAATFTFTSPDPHATFVAQLDNGNFEAVTSPVTFTGLADGEHTFRVAAVDVANSADPSPATVTWRVDTTPPETQITSGPTEGSTTANASVTISFASSEAGTFLGRLDDGEFAPVTSPVTLTALTDGEHTFRVYAVDAAGNVDATPATLTWRVDTTPPETQITGGPAEGSLTASTAATFTFTASKPGATFFAKLDNGAYAPASGSASFTGLSAGSHTFSVYAVDAGGNTDPTPATRTWMVQTNPATSVLLSQNSTVPGAGAPGTGIPAGATWRSYGVPSMNAAGDLAFAAGINTAAGVENIIFKLTAPVGAGEARPQALARLKATAPGTGGAVFSSLKDPLLNEHGDVAFLASFKGGTATKANDQALFLSAFSSATGQNAEASIIAQEGTQPPGAPAGAQWKSFTGVALGRNEAAIGGADGWLLAFTASMSGRGISKSEDSGLWLAAGGATGAPTVQLALREGVELSIGASLKKIKSLLALQPQPSAPGQGHGVTATGVLVQAGFTDGTQALLRVRPGRTEEGAFDLGVEMLSASGESVPNPGGAVTIAKYAPPTQSGTGSVAAWVSALGGSGKPAGVFKSSAPNGVELLLRSGAATGVNGAVFSQFKAVVINDAGHFATLATATGGGLKKSDDDGLWASDSTRSLRLLAREGDMPPGVPGGQWHSFSSVAIAETPGSTVAFVAKMKPKAGGVSAATDTGLWATGSDGVVRLLLREGDVLPGNAGRNVKSFTVLSAVPTSGSQERSLAKSGKLVVRVLAQDRSEHLLQLTVP